MSSGGIGTYLKAAAGSAGEARLVIYKRELATIARIFAP